jgi:hypothetical protein
VWWESEGEIIQLQVVDVKCLDGIDYFDITPVVVDPNDDVAEVEITLSANKVIDRDGHGICGERFTANSDGGRQSKRSKSLPHN